MIRVKKSSLKFVSKTSPLLLFNCLDIFWLKQILKNIDMPWHLSTAEAILNTVMMQYNANFEFQKFKMNSICRSLSKPVSKMMARVYLCSFSYKLI